MISSESQPRNYSAPVRDTTLHLVGGGHPPSWYAIKRHRRDGEPLCDGCLAFQRDYSRAYYRQARNVEPFRLRHNEYARRRRQTRYADPAYRAAFNARRRARNAERRAQDRAELACYVDLVKVERACAWIRVELNRAERLAVIRDLAGRHYSDAQIGERLHTSGDAVCKVRQRAGIAAGVPRVRGVAS